MMVQLINYLLYFEADPGKYTWPGLACVGDFFVVNIDGSGFLAGASKPIMCCLMCSGTAE